jgi:hypothetical protein
MLFGSPTNEMRDQIRPRHTLGQRIPEKARSPPNRSPIAKHQMGVEDDPPQLGVSPRLNEKIRVRCDDIMRTTRCHHCFDLFNGFGECDVVEGHSKKRDGQSSAGNINPGLVVSGTDRRRNRRC